MLEEIYGCMMRHMTWIVCLFFEIETVVRKFGYQSSDLVYYREPGKELDDGLVLLTSDEEVVRMADL
jgi:hypothetical protein